MTDKTIELSKKIIDEMVDEANDVISISHHPAYQGGAASGYAMFEEEDVIDNLDEAMVVAIKALQKHYALVPKAEYKQLEAIRDSVIVLEEGAEPEVGDLYEAYDGNVIKIDHDTWLSYQHTRPDGKIIQRPENGELKPTIQLPKEK